MSVEISTLIYNRITVILSFVHCIIKFFKLLKGINSQDINSKFNSIYHFSLLFKETHFIQIFYTVAIKEFKKYLFLLLQTKRIRIPLYVDVIGYLVSFVVFKNKRISYFQSFLSILKRSYIISFF